MGVSVLMPSYNRPHLLGQVIAEFLAQDFGGAMEIIVLEDSGIWGNATIEGDGWRIVSTTSRYKSVGAKRNALVGLAKYEYLVTADDDDTYFPWHVSAAIAALETCCYAQPRQAFEWDSPADLGRYWVVSPSVLEKMQGDIRLNAREALDICYGGQWSFRKQELVEAGGYPEDIGNGDDTQLCRRLLMKYGNSADTITENHPDPSYIYSRQMSGSWHASELGPGTAPLQQLATHPRENPEDLTIELPPWYSTVAIPQHVKPRKW